MRSGQVDLEMLQMFFAGQCLTPGSVGLREQGGLRTTWLHHSPDKNLPGPLLHQALCWFIMGHQDEAWVSLRHSSLGGFLWLSICSVWLWTSSTRSPLRILWPRFASAEPVNGTKRFFQSSPTVIQSTNPNCAGQRTKRSSIGLVVGCV